MRDERKVSQRGVYYDLTLSPYEFKSPYGDIFKFSSQKKLDMYTRDIENELNRLEKYLARNDLQTLIPSDVADRIRRGTYEALYKIIER